MVNKQGQIIAPKAQGFNGSTPGASYSQTTNPSPTVPPLLQGTGNYPAYNANLAASFPHGVYPPGYVPPPGTEFPAGADGEESKTETAEGEDGEAKTADIPVPPLPQPPADEEAVATADVTAEAKSIEGTTEAKDATEEPANASEAENGDAAAEGADEAVNEDETVTV